MTHAATDVDISMLTERELRELLELRRRQRELRESVVERVQVQIESFHVAKYLYEQAAAVNVASSRCYHEALLFLAEDPDDDAITAIEKQRKFERIEAEFIVAGVTLRNAHTRCEWEIRQVNLA